MVNLQKGFFRLTVVVLVIIGLLFFLLNFEDSQRNVETFFQRDSYEKLEKSYEAGDIYYENETTSEVFTYESHPNYFKDHFRSIGPKPEGFQKVVVFFKAFLFTLLSGTPYVLAVWVILSGLFILLLGL